MGRKNHKAGRRPQATRNKFGGAGKKTPPPPGLDALVMPTGVCPIKNRYGKHKMRFFPESDAAKALKQAQLRHERIGSGHVEKRYYLCKACDGYHLTSKTEWEERSKS